MEREASLETRADFTANLSDWASPTNLSRLLSIMPFLEAYLDDLVEPLPFFAEFEFDFGGALCDPEAEPLFVPLFGSFLSTDND